MLCYVMIVIVMSFSGVNLQSKRGEWWICTGKWWHVGM